MSFFVDDRKSEKVSQAINACRDSPERVVQGAKSRRKTKCQCMETFYVRIEAFAKFATAKSKKSISTKLIAAAIGEERSSTDQLVAAGPIVHRVF
jgi:hypothetical protein